ncbi:MAG TPA: cbb3-type cytochrome c oxidase subunit I [Persephonella sp.]|uniref:CytoChrome c oxidase, subunit I n=1 Tax=Persephonella marina (strain DSM 14350 / EX-H1) TaxID=123214 RepID=C0QTR7_PERMH|nr:MULTISPECIES: cbb3-type cytochrome c oxidase subunit I [Persephonella]ACO03049.1 cytoChrome c oxidase, subunit I [Persephonella marina EX-H1]HCB70301.1 cbb3-type cytochrome c oxidase subunit I [Persephonella sp.]
MSIKDILLKGYSGGLNHEGLSPLQKVTLRFVVIGLLFYGVAAIEGMIMRGYAVKPLPLIDESHYFSIMTAHPIVGIFGSTYLLVFGSFTFLVPYLMKKPIFSIKLANFTWLIMTVGTVLVWLSGFIYHYAPLYTIYWPLPVDFTQFSVAGGFMFVLGVAFIMIGTLAFIFNTYATVFHTPKGQKKQPVKPLLMSAFGIDGFLNIVNKIRGKEPYVKEPPLSLPIVAIFRGTVDTFLDALVILSAGLLILFYIGNEVFSWGLHYHAVDALLYKNIFWWGLDLIADGLVLIYVAGTWYLLAMIISGRNLFMQNIARAALLLELLVSWAVWSHHLLSDQPQPEIMKLASGEMITAFELITQGLAFFITLTTLWLARPLKMSNELKFLLGGLLGFALAVPAGIIQADLGMNRLLHNTQWVAGAHFHVAILVGLTMTLYSAIYVLFPILTNNSVKLYSQKLANWHFWLHLIGGIGMGAFMGMAGIDGMLRRHIYTEGEYMIYMIPAAVFGFMLILAWVLFMFNIVATIGLKGLIGIFRPSSIDRDVVVPETAAAVQKG